MSKNRVMEAKNRKVKLYGIQAKKEVMAQEVAINGTDGVNNVPYMARYHKPGKRIKRYSYLTHTYYYEIKVVY